MNEIINLRDAKETKKKRVKKNDSVFDKIFVDSLKELKEQNLDTFRQTSAEIYQRQLTWDEVTKLEKCELLALYYRFKENIQLQKSIIDLDKLVQIIQICKTGYGGCHSHNFGCTKCNSACNDLDPDVCSGCSQKMAKYIAVNYKSIIKDEFVKD